MAQKWGRLKGGTWWFAIYKGKMTQLKGQWYVPALKGCRMKDDFAEFQTVDG